MTSRLDIAGHVAYGITRGTVAARSKTMSIMMMITPCFAGTGRQRAI
jgi:hypothetical protein